MQPGGAQAMMGYSPAYATSQPGLISLPGPHASFVSNMTTAAGNAFVTESSVEAMSEGMDSRFQ